MLLVVFLALLVAFQATAVSGEVLEPCGSCDQSLCPPATQCPIGTVKDRCECCSICGLEQGHRCNTQRELADIVLGKRNFGFFGKCGNDLECLERTDVSLDLRGTENTCVCLKSGRFCASDGETYSACQMEAVKAKSLGEIIIISYDDCKSEPKIVDFSMSQEVMEGNKTTFWCEIKGYPLPSVTWYFMPPDDSYNAILLPGDSDELSVSLRGAPPGRKIISHLQIRSFSIKHEGTYQCFVENDFGSDRRNITAIYVPLPFESRDHSGRRSMLDEV